MRYQANQNISVGDVVMHAWSIETLPPTHEVSVLVAAGVLVPEGEDGSFPAPPAPPKRCCGG